MANFLLCATAMIVGSKIQPWFFPTSLLIPIIYGLNRKKTSIVLLFLGAFAISFLMGYLTFDTTFDSISYHKPTIQALSNNWNPIYDNRGDLGLWTLHYARGLELQASTIASTGLGLEASKAINFMFFFSTIALAFAALRKTFPELSSKQIAIAVFVLMSNPVVLSQLFTFYNDAYLYMEVISMIALFMIWHKNSGKTFIYSLMLISVTLMAVNTKFTHLFFCCLIWGGFWIYLLWTKNYKLLRKAFLLGTSAIVLGVVFIGFNPYITNTLTTGDPFYPLLSNRVDIMTTNTPEILVTDNRFLAFVKAQLSNETQAWSVVSGNVNLQDFLKPSADSRTLGFGLLFAPLFIFSIILMLINKASKNLWIALALSLVPLAFFEQSWWARYIPFPWIIITIGIISYFKRKSDNKSNNLLCSKILYFIILIMVVMTMVITVGRNAGRRIHARFQPEIIESISDTGSQRTHSS